MRLGREHSADRASGPIGFEQQTAGRRREAPAREIAPAVPSRVLRIRPRARRDADILHQVLLFRFVAHERRFPSPYAARSAISFLVSAIALAGLSPLGHTFAQFMIVWQR